MKKYCQANTDGSSLTLEILTLVSDRCSIVLDDDLQDIYKIFHFRASRTAAVSRAVCLRKVSYMCALRGAAFGRTMIYKTLSCPNRLLFLGTSQATLSAFQLICFLSAWLHSPALGAACNLIHHQYTEARPRPRGRFQEASG